MPTLDVSGELELPDSGLEVLHHDGDCTQLANDAGLCCPACEDEFVRLFVTDRRTATFSSAVEPFCIVRTEAKLLLLTH